MNVLATCNSDGDAGPRGFVLVALAVADGDDPRVDAAGEPLEGVCVLLPHPASSAGDCDGKEGRAAYHSPEGWRVDHTLPS